ncbi:MAG TPA: outer membrane protein assembly factor BamA [Pseudomonadales bacterium]|nr:outer membrane protein assembly factor BamA [Pseudomonadales bacterium]
MINVVKRAVFCLLLIVVPTVYAQGGTTGSSESRPEAQGVFRIADIRVDGLQRVSPGTVFAALPVNVGDELDSSRLQELTRALFRTGYFDDIQINRDRDVLIIKVVERPTVAEISISGNKVIKTEDLTSALKKAGLAEGQIYKPSTLDAMSAELERQYVSQGRYGAKVKTNVNELPRNRVGLSIMIDEGEVAAIKAVNIVGNKAFPTEELLKFFQLETTNWLSWIRDDDKYSREKLTGDLEKLRSFYMDRGYLRFNIESTQVSLSDDKESIFITINILEGDVYNVSAVELSGELVVPEDEIRSLIMLAPGQAFSQINLTESKDAISKRLGNEGYTYADVRVIPERDDSAKTVKVTFFVDPSHRAYVNRINFRGNTKTADDVLRREMRQMEAATADTAKIEQSKQRLERLGYFKTVDVATTDVPGTGDQIDVEYTVEEQSSGSIGASVGFAQDAGIILGANVQQDNFLGTGKQVGVGVSTSSYTDQINFNYTDPYYTVDGVSRGFNLYYITRDLKEVNVASYSVDSYGLDMNFGYPLSEIERLGFGVGYANNHIKVGSAPAQEISGTPIYPDPSIDYVKPGDLADCIDLPSAGTPCIRQPWTAGMEVNPVYKGFLNKYGDTFDDIKLTGSWSQSTLNKARLATRGHSQTVALEGTAPGVSDLEYWKASYRGQYFKPINDTFTLHFRGRFGYGAGYSGTDELPFFESFYGGGFGSVRGYKRNSLGPRSTPAVYYPYSVLPNGELVYLSNASGTALQKLGNPDGNDDPIGGDMILDGSAELIFPMPFVKDQSAMQPSIFLDAGNVFGTQCSSPYGIPQVNCSNFDLGELRYSTGVGLTWVTGFGPLTFSIAKALNSGNYDDTEVFQFSLGQNF